jgi:curved DNA-binding protein CbpA
MGIKLDFDRCLQILELDSCASQEEAGQAYRDLIRVWHPDRFSGDPRLSSKADEKVKEINIAYKELVRYIKKNQFDFGMEDETQVEKDAESMSSTEAAFEYGTRKVLAFWHSLSKAVKVAVKEANDDVGDDKVDR